MNPKEDLQTKGENEGGRLGALVDLALVIGVLVLVKQAILPYSVVFAGPVSTLSGMIIGTFLLYRRGQNWAALGFRWPQSWKSTAGWSLVIFAALLATSAASSAIADLWFEDIGTSGRFDFVQGNLPGYLMVMALVWTHGSFFEELLFRAFTITRLSDVLGGERWTAYAAVVVAAVFFGYRHYYYQGVHGAIATGCIGLVFGLFYLRLRKTTILPLILVHGAANSIAQTSRFLS